MDSVNTFLSGFKTITTPYDKVDHKARNIQNIINLIGGGDGDGDVDSNGPDITEEFRKRDEKKEELRRQVERNMAEEANANAKAQTANQGTGEIVQDTSESNPSNSENNAESETPKEKGGIRDYLAKRALKAAEAGEAERTTELPEGTYIMENIIKIGTVIIYILLLPLIPWYYVMKYSYRKMSHLYNNMFKPM